VTTYGVYPEPRRRVGQHYEKKGTTVTKYYFAGATRLAVRTNGTLSYLLGDHLGSSSVTTNASGVKTASALYKAFGETRYSSGALGTDYKFTGQREQAELGLYFYGARWFDPSIGRFTSPDTMIPSAQGVQAWDRYAYVNNNPVRYMDPTGHMRVEDPGSKKGCSDPKYCENGKPKTYSNPPPQPTVSDGSGEGSSGGSGSGNNTNTTDCWTQFWMCYNPDALMWGVGFSGSEPGLYYVAGLEEILMFSDATRAVFEYEGQGSSVGAGASAEAYLGAVFNLGDKESYGGPFGAEGFTISIGDVGLTAFYFHDSSKLPLTPGATQGIAVGYAPGAQASVFWASTVYQMIWKSDQ